MIEKFAMYLNYPFVQYALIVGTLIALCSSLLGVVVLYRRYTLIGDTLSSVAFGATAVAGVLSIVGEMVLSLPLTVLAAVLLFRVVGKGKITSDTAMAMISVSAMAGGYLIMNLFPPSSNLSSDVCTTLFGTVSILTLTPREVWISILASVVLLVLFVLFYNKIFASIVDRDFAKSIGLNVERIDTFLAVAIAGVVVLAINLVGSLLTTALLVFPAITSSRMFRSFKAVTVSAAILSVLCALGGMAVSVVFGTPVGSTIAVTNLFVFLIVVLGKVAVVKFF